MASLSDVILRPPTRPEVPRAIHLFRYVELPPPAHVLVAVRSQPVERFVAGIAGWTEGGFGRFHLAYQPGATQGEILRLLLEEAAATARAAGVRKLLYAELLTDDEEWAATLRANDFTVLRSERFFRIAVPRLAERLTRMMEKHRGGNPSGMACGAHPPPCA